ncbi:uncharacterized protein LOC126722181 [Quercus robur]|uniref:uncharacterized protein LOC126722181 n=1 Tax=Quercus robur TaxID=38942 RepID=UPI002162D9B3|nr:uncharacterized protein LOC126722181 [Quercus robur]
MFQDIAAAGLGVVIRDHEGKVIGALSERIALPPSVNDVEALACRRAISFAQKIGLQEVYVVFETIIKSLNSDEFCLAPFGHLIEDSLQLISSFRSLAFSHVKRKGNCVANKLAKQAKGSTLSQIWLEDIHSDATNLVMLDISFC